MAHKTQEKNADLGRWFEFIETIAFLRDIRWHTPKGLNAKHTHESRLRKISFKQIQVITVFVYRNRDTLYWRTILPENSSLEIKIDDFGLYLLSTSIFDANALWYRWRLCAGMLFFLLWNTSLQILLQWTDVRCQSEPYF